MDRDPVMTVMTVIVGVVLLVPGGCALAFGFMVLKEQGPDAVAAFWFVWVPCLAIAFGGIMLIRWAFK
jgi:uncharacterized membrane protein YjjB (DUF3815 family)